LLQSEFEQAESAYLKASPPEVDLAIRNAADILFTTRTQAFREALLGCALARVIDPDIDITLPYASHGSNAFNGRTLDEQVVNPFLVSKQLPCSKGPYLAVFRRSVRFTRETREGIRDKVGYDAFLQCLDALKQAEGDQARNLLRYLLYRFVELRESSSVHVVALERMSLLQIAQVVENLLSRPSGGMLPVLVAVALLNTITRVYRLAWRIEWQPINVADRVSGVGGDITVWDGERIYLVIEVTEREVDRDRVEATLRNKISPLGLQDYLFAFTSVEPQKDAKSLAQMLFAQGHEVGFIRVNDWVYYNIATAGSHGRQVFLQEVTRLLNGAPAAVKMVWNDAVQQLFSTSTP
jgi:hypothetical protein